MTRILLIDDDEFVRESLSIVLEDAGYEVTTADNGKTGIKQLTQQKFDVMITDVVMPEKDGIEVLMEAKRNYPDTKVIVISGGGRINVKDYLSVAEQLEAHGVLAKPFTNQELLGKVSELL